MRVVALLDASILYPATMRSVLMYLAVAGTYRARWSAGVQDEWIAALSRDRPDIDPRRLERTRLLMDTRIPDAVVTGYEGIISNLTLPDPNDRHVLAAAIQGGADVIVTQNLKHFPAQALAPYEMAACDPDKFVLGLTGEKPTTVVAALAADRARLRNPGMTAAEYLASLEHAGLVQTAAALKTFEETL